MNSVGIIFGVDYLNTSIVRINLSICLNRDCWVYHFWGRWELTISLITHDTNFVNPRLALINLPQFKIVLLLSKCLCWWSHLIHILYSVHIYITDFLKFPPFYAKLFFNLFICQPVSFLVGPFGGSFCNWIKLNQPLPFAK